MKPLCSICVSEHLAGAIRRGDPVADFIMESAATALRQIGVDANRNDVVLDSIEHSEDGQFYYVNFTVATKGEGGRNLQPTIV